MCTKVSAKLLEIDVVMGVGDLANIKVPAVQNWVGSPFYFLSHPLPK